MLLRIFLTTCCLLTATGERASNKEWLARWERIEEWLDSSLSVLAESEQRSVTEDEYDPPIEIPDFTCDVNLPGGPPTSVHQLRPNDVKVVAAFGDSISAGNGLGADSLPGVAIENRGESWYIGGNGTLETVLTIPNLLKKYNPDVTGWSYSRPGIDGDRNRTHCGVNMECAQLNVAEPGGTNEDMPPQADNLVQKIQDFPDIDIENDWKVISLFVGGNDLCAVCRKWDQYKPENYVRNLQLAIDKVKASIPRVYFQIVVMFDVSPLQNFSRGPVCDIMHNQFCDCGKYNDSTIGMLRPIQYQYWELLDELINVNGTYDGDDSFTVVLQPYLRDQPPPTFPDGSWDRSFLAPDCFHFNRKGHQTMALWLWNIMLVPVQDKPFVYPIDSPMEFSCPTGENPYFFTNDNSRRYAELGSQTGQIVKGQGRQWRKQFLAAQQKMKKHGVDVEQVDENKFEIPSFTCDVDYLPDFTPTSVHELRPNDIKVIAAFGDSITAGNGVGASTIPQVAIEHRGESWSIGGNNTIDTVLTIPNLLLEYNPALTGWSYSRPALPDDFNRTYCGREMPCAGLNVAEPGDTNRDMPPQADMIIERIYNDSSIDVQQDWKFITLLIGGNDLCGVCRKWDVNNPDYYVQSIKTAMDKLKAALPRTMVHIVAMFDITPVSNFSTSLGCDIMQMQFCDCAIYNDSTTALMRPVQMGYWEKLNELININGTYDGDDDFTVVLQPHMRDLIPPKLPDGGYDTSFLSADCFHPSRKGHFSMAYQFWNMLFTPVPEKPFVYPDEEEKVFKCPSQDNPFIATNDNSRVQKTDATSIKKNLEQLYKHGDRTAYNKALQQLDELEYNARMKKTERILNKMNLNWNMADDTIDRYDDPLPPVNCDIQSYPPATNVHQLRPNDIRVVASFGDSITAGNGLGAETLPEVAIENRGESWSIGGNQTAETVFTIPNILKKFNPDVTGWSWSRDSRTDRNETYCGNDMRCSQLNVAAPGATARSCPGQAQEMVERLKDTNFTEGNIDYENDWKLITLFIGGNDLCRVCNDWEDFNPEAYRDRIQEALDILYADVPRALVNLVIMFDITPLANMSNRPICEGMQWGFCDCGRRPEFLPYQKQIQMDYWRLLEELVASGRYDGRDDFTVVIQPHQRDIEPVLDEDGNIDHSYFSPDCFHPSRKGHQGFAYMLWNVMLIPVGHKPYKYDAYEEQVVSCPSEDYPYIFTRNNSNVVWPPPPPQKKSKLLQPEENKSYEELYTEWVQKVNSDPVLAADAAKHTKKADDSIDIPPFNCVVEEFPPASSVHELRPNDIQVVAALGDSVSAGMGIGAETIEAVSIQHRGESWLAGSNETIETVLTIPNLIKMFNPDVTGWSWTKKDSPQSCAVNEKCAQLNMATGGHTNRNMLAQAESLVQRMKQDFTLTPIDFENDWKLISLFIGGNDLCRYCTNGADFNPRAYREGIEAALDHIYDEIPRVFVNLIIMFDVTPLSNISTGPTCDSRQESACPCAIWEEPKADMKRVQMAYYTELVDLVDSGKYERDDFTVVIQPHMRDAPPPVKEDGSVDHSYWSPDCFHPGRKGHQEAAYTLWNTMLIPVGQKPFNYVVETPRTFSCPSTDYPYFFTSQNSDVTWPPSQINAEENIGVKPKEKSFEEVYEEVMKRIETDRAFAAVAAAAAAAKYKDTDDSIEIPPFTCETGDFPKAATVHELRPNDIQVVGALGDSITAAWGVGAETLAGVPIQQKGESWTIGANESIASVLTIPNLIRPFNPDVTGWSWTRERLGGNRTGSCGSGNECSQLNVAVGGHTNRQMLSQAERLVQRMKEDFTLTPIDYENDWKLISLFVGGNDLCRVCINEADYNPQAYREGIQLALDHIKAEVPRVFVNLIIMFDITPLGNVSTGAVCDIIQFGACSCAIRPRPREELRRIQLEYYNELVNLVNSGIYESDDFTVVIQPHMRDALPPVDEDGNIDHSYFSPDCFHPSRKGHQELAYTLWNTMLIPVGQKPFQYPKEEQRAFYCPSEDYPYFFTSQNSDVTWPPLKPEHHQEHNKKQKKPYPFKPFIGEAQPLLHQNEFNYNFNELPQKEDKGDTVPLAVLSAVAAVCVTMVMVGAVIGYIAVRRNRKRKPEKQEISEFQDITTQHVNEAFQETKH